MAIRDINLVPTEILNRRYLFRHLCVWAGCLIISLSLISGFYLFQIHVVASQKPLTTTLKDVHTQMGVTIEEIKEIQEEIERLSQQETFLKSITGNRPYSIILLKLANIMNDQIWLNQLTLDSLDSSKEGEHSPSLRLIGFSLSNKELGDFLSRLSEEPLFEAVILKYAKETKIVRSPKNPGKRIRVIQFQIDCNISKA